MKKKILWVGAKSLHDTTSIESLNSRLLVNALASLNDVEVSVVNTFSFTERESYFLRSMVEFDQVRASFSINDGNVKYYYINCSTKIYKNLNIGDFDGLNHLCIHLINNVKPDLIIGLAQNNFILSAIFAEAKLRHIPTASLVLNNDLQEYAFYHTDAYLSPYESLAKLYLQKYQKNIQIIQTLFDKNASIVKTKNAKYTVAIDYGNQAEFDLFINLVLKAQAQDSKQMFLLIRRDEDRALDLLDNYNKNNNTNYCLDDFTNLDITPMPYDIKELISLSKYFINFNSTDNLVKNNILSFLANGIPVLSVADDKLLSIVGNAGICVEAQYANNGSITNTDDFYNALLNLIDKYNEYKKACATQTRVYDLKNVAYSAIEVLDPLLAQHASLQSQYVCSGSLAKVV